MLSDRLTLRGRPLTLGGLLIGRVVSRRPNIVVRSTIFATTPTVDDKTGTS